MPSELELSMLARLAELEKQVAALSKKLASRPAEAARRAPEKKEVKEVKANVR